MAVQVFFPKAERGDDCNVVYPVQRRVRPPAVATNALRHLLRGPTADERNRGFAGWFGTETAGMLNGVVIRKGTAFVDFDDFSAVIPNASSSCGSTMLLAQLDRTLLQFPTIHDTRYSFDGDAPAFYEWLQMTAP